MSRRSRGPRIAIAVGSAGVFAMFCLLVAGSCAVPGFELVDTTAVPGGGAGGTGGTGGASTSNGGSAACDSIEPPLSPTNADPGGDVDFVTAARTLNFGEDFDDMEGPTVGYDLDTRCTCLGDEPSCATVGNMPVDCDGPRGRDNAVARLFDNLSLFEPTAFNSQSHSAAMNSGEFTLLFRVSDYNGTPNDEDVTLAIYTSPGLDADPCLGDTVPKWDGTDAWPVEAFSVATGGAGGMGGMSAGGNGGGGGCDANTPGYDVDQPAFVSEFAYVNNNELVANLPTAGIALGVDDATVIVFQLVGGFVTARIEPSGGAYFLRGGVLTGRWSLADFFGVVGTFTTGGERICKDSPLYGPIKEIVCNYADIHAQILSPATPCDAMSFGMSFEAEPALLGPVVEEQQGAGGGDSCAPGEEPAGDDCSDQE